MLILFPPDAARGQAGDRPSRSAVWLRILAAASCLLFIGSCHDLANNPHSDDANAPKIRGVSFDDPIKPVVHAGVISLSAAKNETVSFGLQLTNLSIPSARHLPLLRLHALELTAKDSIDPAQYTVYQVLDMPVDLNRAGFVRHTGLEVASRKLPRALLPAMAEKGEINLSALRDPAQPLSPQGRALSAAGQTAPITLWVDLTVPATAKAGQYNAVCEIMQNGVRVASTNLALTVYDFVIPDERHLEMVGTLDWPGLIRHYPDLFETITPYLMTRNESRYKQALSVLDSMIKLAQDHRLDLVVPRLQPQVKWPASSPPDVTWSDFDSIVSPWLKGDAFADHVPLGYWPLPSIDFLDRYDRRSQEQYWSAAAAHFDQLDWLSRCPLTIEKTSQGPVDAKDTIQLSMEAAELLDMHPHVRVCVPLEDDQLQLKSDAAPGLIDPKMLDRLCDAARGLVFKAPDGNWPVDLPRPQHYLSTDVNKEGLVPFVGAGGDERDVRLWAWLAFLRETRVIPGHAHPTLVLWGNVLPSQAKSSDLANPDDLIWCYPGHWFGVDAPVPSIQLKWLRRAEQDYEYLYLARERGEVIRTLVAARLITKPVEVQLQPGVKQADPTYALMCGTSDPEAWVRARDLIAQSILLRQPGQAADSNDAIALDGKVLHWAEPQEKPLLLGRTSEWGWSVNGRGAGNWVDLRFGLDIYNAADQRLIGNLHWSSAPEGWQYDPRPTDIPPSQSINVFNIRRFTMDAAVNLNEISADSRKPIEIAFYNELTDRTSLLRFVMPVAECDARQGLPLKIDGVLNDWNEADAMQEGPLVKMFNRPALQHQELQYASTPSSIYSTWGPSDLYIAFKVEGASQPEGQPDRNFAEYQFRRAWGEDLCEVVIQPIYINNALGPVLHLICKPKGQLIVESKLDPMLNANPWQVVAGANVRYAAQAPPEGSGVWRGEIAIPWNLINDARHQGVQPSLLRFNFVQHKAATGESSSWAGPVDFGRDETLMGLLHVHVPTNLLPDGPRAP